MSANPMDIEDEDDFYSPEEPTGGAGENVEELPQIAVPPAQTSAKAEELEEGEEEDEGGPMEEDSDSVGLAEVYSRREAIDIAKQRGMGSRIGGGIGVCGSVLT
jgi:hypothetical protein